MAAYDRDNSYPQEDWPGEHSGVYPRRAPSRQPTVQERALAVYQIMRGYGPVTHRVPMDSGWRSFARTFALQLTDYELQNGRTPPLPQSELLKLDISMVLNNEGAFIESDDDDEVPPIQDHEDIDDDIPWSEAPAMEGLSYADQQLLDDYNAYEAGLSQPDEDMYAGISDAQAFAAIEGYEAFDRNRTNVYTQDQLGMEWGGRLGPAYRTNSAEQRFDENFNDYMRDYGEELARHMSTSEANAYDGIVDAPDYAKEYWKRIRTNDHLFKKNRAAILSKQREKRREGLR